MESKQTKASQRAPFKGTNKQLAHCIETLLDSNEQGNLSHHIPPMAVQFLEAARHRLASEISIFDYALLKWLATEMRAKEDCNDGRYDEWLICIDAAIAQREGKD